MNEIFKVIAIETDCKPEQIAAAVSLLDQGATVPFISRYRKEVTGGLDDTQMRLVEIRLGYLRELQDRKDAVIAKISELGKLTPRLQQQILQAETKNLLEDLYLPFKVKRRSKAQIAREAGLEPLADKLLANPRLAPEQQADAFLNADRGIDSIKNALDGARSILMERFAEDAALAGKLREFLWRHGVVAVKVVDGKQQQAATYKDYFTYEEAFRTLPSHRALAIFRGRKAGLLEAKIQLPDTEMNPDSKTHPCEIMIATHWNIIKQEGCAKSWLDEVVRWTWRVKLLTRLETDLFARLREQAEREAIKVFADNLKDLLLAAPAGAKVAMGLDPGLRTGVKVAVIDTTGKLLDHSTIYPHPPKNQWQTAIAQLRALCEKHNIELVSIGNGTGARETDKLVAELMSSNPGLQLSKIIVNEAGASVYSASEAAAREFPGLDVTIRGAVSIARRLQDPLAELVKIEPKSIGVGQYQHDVSQSDLAHSLNAVVEDCVNAVGVDVNTASSGLLTRVAGLNNTLANKITHFRDENGPFTDRSDLRKVPGLGNKTFEQAAGFLRIMSGNNPLDASAVHPEAYSLVAAIAGSHRRTVASMIGDKQFLKTLDPQDFTNDVFGVPTIKDVITELDKPGRDPRPEFRFASFQEGVEEIKDLKTAMILEGMVTNITNFGAFVDIGVHQDGLVHISALANKFVKDPREVVKTGDIVKVKVISVDPERKRIALSMRLEDDARLETSTSDDKSAKTAQRKRAKGGRHSQSTHKQAVGSMGALLMAAKEKQTHNSKSSHTTDSTRSVKD